MSYLDTNFADWSHQQPRHLLHFYKNGSTSDIDQLIDGFAVIGTTTAYLFAVLYVASLIVVIQRWSEEASSQGSWLRRLLEHLIPMPAPAAKASPQKVVQPRRHACPLHHNDHGIKHLAVIMDGNRRYGKNKQQEQGGQKQSGKSTASSFVSQVAAAACNPAALYGHKQGGDKLLEFIDWCIALDINILTVYAFSTENWNRPQSEVDYLMSLFRSYFTRILEVSDEKKICIRFVSTEPERLQPSILELMHSIEDKTKVMAANGTAKITVNVCVSYGSCSEMVQVCRRCVLRDRHRGGTGDESSLPTEEDMEAMMLTSISELPDGPEGAAVPHPSRAHPRWTTRPDIILRTSGEQRLSNFLMYQAAYSELFFVSKTWPEMSMDDLQQVVVDFCHRTRRFGK